MGKKQTVERLAAWVIVCAGGLLVLFLAGRYVLPALLPFLLAWGGAFLIRPAACFLHRRLRLPQKAAAVILCVLFWAALFLGLYFLCRRLVLELGAFLQWLSGDPPELEDFFLRVGELLKGLKKWLPGGDTQTGSGAQTLMGIAGSLLGKWPEWAGKFFSALPQILLFSMVTVIASVFFSLDLGRINAAVLGWLPPAWQQRLRSWRRGVFRGAWRYVRAYLVLMVITFGVLLCGFCIIRVRYALLLSAVCAFVDFLPILGVGTVLIPWGLFCLVAGQAGRGIALLVLYIVATAVREFCEPHVVGRQFGMPPLLMLVYLYAGVQIFGFAGLLVGPVIGVLLQSLWQNRKGTPPAGNAGTDDGADTGGAKAADGADTGDGRAAGDGAEKNSGRS